MLCPVPVVPLFHRLVPVALWVLVLVAGATSCDSPPAPVVDGADALAVHPKPEPKGNVFDKDPFFRKGQDPVPKEEPDVVEQKVKVAPIPDNDGVSRLQEDLLDFIEAKLSSDVKFQRQYRTQFDRTIRDNKHFIALMREIYSQRNHAPLFFEFDDQRLPRLSEEGARLKALVESVPTHGLASKDYRIEQIAEGFKRLETATAEYQRIRGELSDPEALKLWSMVEKMTEIPEEKTLTQQLRQSGFSDENRGSVNLLARFYPNLAQSKKQINDVLQELDVALLHGFFQFCLDFRYVRKAHPFEPTPDISLAHAKFQDDLSNDFNAASPGFSSYLEEMIPTSPTYGRLREGLKHYLALRDAGELDKLQVKKTLKRGSKGKEVRELSKRLFLEGYLQEQYISDRFGKEIEDAVRLYQKTHQLEVDGETGKYTRKSLNVSMKSRVQSIELGLQRWRESDITKEHPEFFLRVNIPQFEVEVWDHDQLVRKHRIVVGNRDEAVDVGRKERGRFNHTPLLTSRMNRIVLNPLWYPPPRLRKELLADLEKQPDYFERNNFGIEISPDGSEIVFQKSGPGNALGQVKFLFPNPYKVYLHDTPKKALFNRPIRAYSHGCMRVEKPLDLAEFLLQKVNGMDKAEFKKAIESEKEQNVTLQTQIPLYVEYCTVGVDDSGRVEFYLDVYKYDRAYRHGQLPVQLTEELTESEIQKLRQDGVDLGSGDETDDGVMPGQ